MSEARSKLTLMLICIGSVMFLTCNLLSRLALELGMGMTLALVSLWHWYDIGISMTLACLLGTITLVDRVFELYLRSIVKPETCCLLPRRVRSSIEIGN